MVLSLEQASALAELPLASCAASIRICWPIC